MKSFRHGLPQQPHVQRFDDGTITFTATGETVLRIFRLMETQLLQVFRQALETEPIPWVWAILEGVGKPPLWSFLPIQAGTITALRASSNPAVQTIAMEP